MKLFIIMLISIVLVGCTTVEKEEKTIIDESDNFDSICINGVKHHIRYWGRSGVMSVAYDSKTGVILSCDDQPIQPNDPIVKPSTDSYFTRKEIINILNKLPLEHKQAINTTLIKMIKKDSIYRIADELIE